MIKVSMRGRIVGGMTGALLALAAAQATAQTFHVQCPFATPTHPLVNGQPNPNIKCQQISGGDGYSTMADGTQIYMFSFGPLSGLDAIAQGQPGTMPASIFNTLLPVPQQPGSQPPVYTLDGGVLIGSPNSPGWPAGGFNGAIGLMQDVDVKVEDAACAAAAPPLYCNPSSPYFGLDGHVDPRQIMDVGVMNGNIPAPLMAIDEDDEFFLTLTNVGMIMRPDLFEQHTVHFHGYPNAASFYDGVPDASAAISIGASFTYYYLAPDAGTYFWHCHITPPEHLQMGMVGQLYVRPRQNKVNGDLYAALQSHEVALPGNPTAADYDNARKRCGSDTHCAAPLPVIRTGASNDGTRKYAYNDGDGSTQYEVEYPIQMHGFDPNFHFVGMTFNPEAFVDMKDKYFLLNGRSYPDTVTPAAMTTPSSDGTAHVSQPMPTIVNIQAGQRALLRISSLDVTEYQTLASVGIPMKVIGYNAKLLRDLAGNNLYYTTNSITLGGGESLDVILDTCIDRRADGSCSSTYPPGTYYLYTPNLDHLSNGAENFGGLMTEVHVN